MVLMESFRHYNKVVIRKEENLKSNMENNGNISNLASVRNENERPKNDQSMEKSLAYTPHLQEKKAEKDATANTNYTTLSKQS